MPIIAVNVIKVLFVVVLYGFLFYIARSMRGHVAGPPPDHSAASAPQPSQWPHPTGPGSPPTAQTRSILIFDVDQRQTRHPIGGGVVLGRGDSADIRIDDEFASEKHASFVLDGGIVLVEDLGSTNGTTIDGKPITGPTEVPSGTAVMVGRTKVVVT